MAQYPAPQNDPNDPRLQGQQYGSQLNDPRYADQGGPRRVTNDPRYATGGPRLVENEERRPDTLSAINVASPAALGLGVIGIITAILGCFYTGFITPYQSAAIRPSMGAAMLILGIILVLAGMWEFRKSYMLTATLFTSYGGILAVLGVIFLPTGVIAPLAGGVHLLLALVFLVWTIYLGVLLIGSARTNASLATTIVLLFVSFFFLMLGSFIFNNGILIRIGGWFAIATAIVAWCAAVATLLSTAQPHEAFHLKMSRRLAVVE